MDDWDFSEYNTISPLNVNLSPILEIQDNTAIVRALVQQSIKCGFMNMPLEDTIIKKIAPLKTALEANLQAAKNGFLERQNNEQASAPSQASPTRVSQRPRSLQELKSLLYEAVMAANQTKVDVLRLRIKEMEGPVGPSQVKGEKKSTPIGHDAISVARRLKFNPEDLGKEGYQPYFALKAMNYMFNQGRLLTFDPPSRIPPRLREGTVTVDSQYGTMGIFHLVFGLWDFAIHSDEFITRCIALLSLPHPTPPAFSTYNGCRIATLAVRGMSERLFNYLKVGVIFPGGVPIHIRVGVTKPDTTLHIHAQITIARENRSKFKEETLPLSLQQAIVDIAGSRAVINTPSLKSNWHSASKRGTFFLTTATPAVMAKIMTSLELEKLIGPVKFTGKVHAQVLGDGKIQVAHATGLFPLKVYGFPSNVDADMVCAAIAQIGAGDCQIAPFKDRDTNRVKGKTYFHIGFNDKNQRDGFIRTRYGATICGYLTRLALPRPERDLRRCQRCGLSAHRSKCRTAMCDVCHDRAHDTNFCPLVTGCPAPPRQPQKFMPSPWQEGGQSNWPPRGQTNWPPRGQTQYPPRGQPSYRESPRGPRPRFHQRQDRAYAGPASSWTPPRGPPPKARGPPPQPWSSRPEAQNWDFTPAYTAVPTHRHGYPIERTPDNMFGSRPRYGQTVYAQQDPPQRQQGKRPREDGEEEEDNMES
jgi:hypothetical protein